MRNEMPERPLSGDRSNLTVGAWEEIHDLLSIASDTLGASQREMDARRVDELQQYVGEIVCLTQSLGR